LSRPLARTRFYKKLSYRKQIVRQLHTEYVEGIYNNSVTLKSGLEVTRGLVKLVPFESLGAVSYLPSIVDKALSCIVCEI